MDGEEEMQPRSSCSENSPACHPTMSQSPAAADEEDDAFLEEPPEMSMAETHPDANMPGFVPDVADKFVKKYVFRSKSKTTQGGYDTVTVVIQEVYYLQIEIVKLLYNNCVHHVYFLCRE